MSLHLAYTVHFFHSFAQTGCLRRWLDRRAGSPGVITSFFGFNALSFSAMPGIYLSKALQEVKAREGGDGIDESDGMESNDESFKFVNKAAKPVHIKSAMSVRPVYVKRPWHASHHKDHTSLRSSDRWANNWPKHDKGQCCIKSKLRQKYTTTEWKYPTSGWRKRARSEETSWTLPSTITLKSRHASHHKGHTSLHSSDWWANN